MRHIRHAHVLVDAFFSHVSSHPLVHHPKGVLLVYRCPCLAVCLPAGPLTPSVSAGGEAAAAEARPKGKRGKKGRTVLLSGGLNF